MEYKDFSDQKIVNVKCDFCGRDMECPEEMLKTSKKHMCSTCFKNPDNLKGEDIGKVHIDMPMDEVDSIMAGRMAEEFSEKAFPMMWSSEKKELRRLSKKEMSKEVFEAGVYVGIQFMFDHMKKMEEMFEEDIE